MSPVELEVLEAARCTAMVDVDLDALDRLFSDELRWAHASGKINTKAEMIAQFGEGSMRCFTIERSEQHYRVVGTSGIATGLVTMDAMTAGVRKQVFSRYIGIWSDHDVERQLVAWQSARAT